MDLKEHIRDVPDFPKQGIVFKDITTMLQNPEVFKFIIDSIIENNKNENIDVVIGAEARGFIFGGVVAYKLGASFVPVRKPGKLPYKTISETYELEYGTDSFEIHVDAVKPGDRVLIIDDLLATGGTAKAIIKLVEKLGGSIEGIDFIIELTFLNGRKNIGDYEVRSLVQYDSE